MPPCRKALLCIPFLSFFSVRGIFLFLSTRKRTLIFANTLRCKKSGKWTCGHCSLSPLLQCQPSTQCKKHMLCRPHMYHTCDSWSIVYTSFFLLGMANSRRVCITQMFLSCGFEARKEISHKKEGGKAYMFLLPRCGENSRSKLQNLLPLFRGRRAVCREVPGSAGLNTANGSNS